MRLAGKVAIISGAASGMGAATARRFGKEGAHVVIADMASLGDGEVAIAGRRVRDELREQLGARHLGQKRMHRVQWMQ